MSPVPSKSGAAEDRDQTPPTCSCLVSFKVDEELLDMMAADDVNRNRTALETLEENKKITRAERYLRKRFRLAAMTLLRCRCCRCRYRFRCILL